MISKECLPVNLLLAFRANVYLYISPLYLYLSLFIRLDLCSVCVCFIANIVYISYGCLRVLYMDANAMGELWNEEEEGNVKVLSYKVHNLQIGRNNPHPMALNVRQYPIQEKMQCTSGHVPNF